MQRCPRLPWWRILHTESIFLSVRSVFCHVLISACILWCTSALCFSADFASQQQWQNNKTLNSQAQVVCNSGVLVHTSWANGSDCLRIKQRQSAEAWNPSPIFTASLTARNMWVFWIAKHIIIANHDYSRISTGEQYKMALIHCSFFFFFFTKQTKQQQKR